MTMHCFTRYLQKCNWSLHRGHLAKGALAKAPHSLYCPSVRVGGQCTVPHRRLYRALHVTTHQPVAVPQASARRGAKSYRRTRHRAPLPQSNAPGTKSGSSCWDAIGDPNRDNRKGKQMGVVNRMVDWVASTQSTPPATTAWRSKILRLGNSIYFQVLHINTILHLNLLLRRSITPQRLSKFRSSDYLDFSIILCNWPRLQTSRQRRSQHTIHGRSLSFRVSHQCFEHLHHDRGCS